jgi:hypothetical protein
MYATPQGREAVAPGLGCDPAAAPRLDRRLERGEQPRINSARSRRGHPLGRSRCASAATGAAPVNILCARNHITVRLKKSSAPSGGGQSKSNLAKAPG